MKIENIQAAHRARPFKPFTIHSSSGESHLVRHPETLAVSPDVSVLVVMPGPGQVVMIDVESVTEISYDFNSRKMPVEG